MTSDVDIEARLRAAFADRADRTIVRDQLNATQTSSASRGRSFVPFLGVAAASILLVVGLLAVRGGRSNDPLPPSESTAPPATDVTSDRDSAAVDVVSDPLAISLDAWRQLPAAGAETPRFLIVDAEQLPTEFVVTEQSGSTFLGGTADKPEYGALVRIKRPDGTVLFVSVEGREFASSCGQLEEVLDTDAERYDINGVDAAMVGASLCFRIDEDINVGIAAGPLAADFDPQTFVEVARALQFVEVDRMPNTRVESSPPVAVLDPEFAGTLGGVQWSATVSDSSLRGMQIYLDGRSSSGFESDRLNQPTDFPAAGGEVSIGGTPGAGAMVYGFINAAVDGVVVRSGDGIGVRLPVVSGPLGLESYFAIPVPEGVELGVVEFVDASNDVVATMTLPYLPRDLSGAYGGYVNIVLV